MSDKQFKFEADTGKILNIVINSLYSQRRYFSVSLFQTRQMPLTKGNLRH